MISRELHRYCVSIKPSPIHWKNSTNKSKLYIVSDGCASQFRSRYVFSLLKHIHPDITIEWHYNEAHHGKGPMMGPVIRLRIYFIAGFYQEMQLLTLLENLQNLQIKSPALIVCSSTNQNLFKSQKKYQKPRQICQRWKFTRPVVFVMVHTHFPITFLSRVKIWSHFT